MGCIENLFTYNGRQGHEIIQLYQCDFADAKFYKLESLVFYESENHKHRAMWIDIARFKSGELRLVPEEFLITCNFLKPKNNFPDKCYSLIPNVFVGYPQL